MVALAVRLQFVFAATAVSNLTAVVLRASLASGILGAEHSTASPSVAAASAAASALAIGFLWPRTRIVATGYLALVCVAQFALQFPAQAELRRAALGVLVTLVLQHWFAARRLGFVADRKNASFRCLAVARRIAL